MRENRALRTPNILNYKKTDNFTYINATIPIKMSLPLKQQTSSAIYQGEPEQVEGYYKSLEWSFKPPESEFSRPRWFHWQFLQSIKKKLY